MEKTEPASGGNAHDSGHPMIWNEQDAAGCAGGTVVAGSWPCQRLAARLSPSTSSFFNPQQMFTVTSISAHLLLHKTKCYCTQLHPLHAPRSSAIQVCTAYSRYVPNQAHHSTTVLHSGTPSGLTNSLLTCVPSAPMSRN